MKSLARDVYEKYFKAAQTQPRGVVAKLGNIVAQIERACQKQVRIKEAYTVKPYVFVYPGWIPTIVLNFLGIGESIAPSLTLHIMTTLHARVY